MKNAELKFSWEFTRQQMVWKLKTFTAGLSVFNNMFMGETKSEALKNLASLSIRRSSMGLSPISIH